MLRAVMSRRPAIDLPGDLVRAEAWFEETGGVELQEAWIDTLQIDLRQRAGWLKLGALGALVIASAIAFAYSSRDSVKHEDARQVSPQPAIHVAAPAPLPPVPPASISAAIPSPPATSPPPARSRSKPQGVGVLMISSKPPCTILIDGARTGLTTPQRSIPLRSGTHKVTLVNEERHIRDSFDVAILPKRPTKVVHDLMKP